MTVLTEAATELQISVKTLRGHIDAAELGRIIVSHGHKRLRRRFAPDDIDRFKQLRKVTDQLTMSVYKRKAKIHFFDFWLSGIRFYRPTGERQRRTAEAFEDAERDKARETLKLIKAQATAPMTVNIAFDRFWLEVGAHYSGGKGSYRDMVWTALKWVASELGPATPPPRHRCQQDLPRDHASSRRGRLQRHGEPHSHRTHPQDPGRL